MPIERIAFYYLKIHLPESNWGKKKKKNHVRLHKLASFSSLCFKKMQSLVCYWIWNLFSRAGLEAPVWPNELPIKRMPSQDLRCRGITASAVKQEEYWLIKAWKKNPICDSSLNRWQPLWNIPSVKTCLHVCPHSQISFLRLNIHQKRSKQHTSTS